MLVHELIFNGDANKVAIIDGKQRILYRELQEKVSKYRNYLYNCGIRAGENVGLFSRNSPEYIYAYMALAGLGAVVVPINFQLSMREVSYIAKNAQMRFMITCQPLTLSTDVVVNQLFMSDINEMLVGQSMPDAPKLPQSFSDEENCVIIYTSGTTGSPKGAVLSHKNLTSNASMFSDAIGIMAIDNVLCILPMYHCFAWTCAVLNPLLGGATIVILDTFSPKETTNVIKKENISLIYAVPSICNVLTRHADPEDMVSVRCVVVGGTMLPLKVAQDFIAHFGINIVEGYGLSEASPVVAVNPPQRVKNGSIGKPLPELTVRIVDEQDQPVPNGQIGEIIVQGDSIMKGYFNLPEDTVKALRNGWLHTGDLAYQDEEGYIFIVDRLKDMIISMGENIYPREIEEVLYHYPGVQEAAVVGIPDKLRGQAGIAFVVMGQDNEKPNKREIKEYLQNNLALYKVPREINFYDKLPKSSTGKILKQELVKMKLQEC